MALSPVARKALATLPRLPDNPWVIAGPRPGRRLGNLNGRWLVVRARAELQDVRIHDLRHSFASRALALGESDRKAPRPPEGADDGPLRPPCARVGVNVGCQRRGEHCSRYGSTPYRARRQSTGLTTWKSVDVLCREQNSSGNRFCRTKFFEDWDSALTSRPPTDPRRYTQPLARPSASSPRTGRRAKQDSGGMTDHPEYTLSRPPSCSKKPPPPHYVERLSLTNVTDDSLQYGIFSVSPDQRANGSLTLAGRESQLLLWSGSPLEIPTDATITGVLDNLTKVSLIGCNIRSEGHVAKGDQIRHKYLVSPQCVLFGSRHISDNEDVVREISFMLEHAVALFHDSDAYGTIFNNSAATAMVAKINNPESSIEVKDSSWVSYYTGKKTVFTSDTVLGRVSANHTPVFTMGNDHDHGLEKATELSIKFAEPLPVIESLHRMGRVLQFVDLVVGYAQNVSSISVHTGFDDPSHSFELYAMGFIYLTP